LRERLGIDMTIEECIQRGKDEDLLYVGLQHGNECWGDVSLGGYGKVEDAECHMPCSRDTSKFCGGGWRNFVYDLKNLGRANQNDQAKITEECKKADPEYSEDKWVDCTNKGGWDPADPCKKTCLSEEPVSEIDACELMCAAQANQMSFRSEEDQKAYERSCTM